MMGGNKGGTWQPLFLLYISLCLFWTLSSVAKLLSCKTGFWCLIPHSMGVWGCPFAILFYLYYLSVCGWKKHPRKACGCAQQHRLFFDLWISQTCPKWAVLWDPNLRGSLWSHDNRAQWVLWSFSWDGDRTQRFLYEWVADKISSSFPPHEMVSWNPQSSLSM